MAEDNKKTAENSNTKTEEKKKAKIEYYEQLIDRLKKEREDLRNEVDNEYREARRYVRLHPEEGVFYAFVGGIALGYLFGKIGRKS